MKKVNLISLLIFILLFYVTINNALAENWNIIGGSLTPNNYSDNNNQGLYYQYNNAGLTNLTIAYNQCSPSDIDYSIDGVCNLPVFANRTDFDLFGNPYLWWHPSSTFPAILRFNSPITASYDINVTFYVYVGGGEVDFYIRKSDDTLLFNTNLSNGQDNTSQHYNITITQGDYLKFIAQTPDTNYAKSSGIIINISNNLIICNNLWFPQFTTCNNNSQIKYYIDLNNCGNNVTLPNDNGTSVFCGVIPTNNTNSTNIVYIVNNFDLLWIILIILALTIILAISFSGVLLILSGMISIYLSFYLLQRYNDIFIFVFMIAIGLILLMIGIISAFSKKEMNR